MRRIAILVGAALVASVVWTPPLGAGGLQPAEPAAETALGAVVFDGSGWGHGLGMSQWGAYGLSVKGKGYKAILRHYFQGSGTGPLGKGRRSPSSPIVVNLEQDFTSLVLRVDALSAKAKPVTIMRNGKKWKAPPGSKIRITGKKLCAITVTRPNGKKTKIPAGKCTFDLTWYNWRKAAPNPVTAVAIVGCTLTDWNVKPAQTRECRYAHGKLHVRSGPGGLDLSARMRLEDYVLGIAEMPYYWAETKGRAALRAQAVAARSYARELQLTRGPVANNLCGAYCHVRDTTWDQRYVGYGHLQAAWRDAVRSTAGIVITHPKAPQQGIVRAYYGSSTGGRTESIEDVRTSPPVPYYKSVNDIWAVDGTVPNPNASWRLTVPAADVAAAVGLDYLTAVKVVTRTKGGSAKTVAFTGLEGGTKVTVERSGAWVRATFNLKSAYFTPTGKKVAKPCVIVQAGEGWAAVTVRLGLPVSDWPKVRDANPHAVNANGYLMVGAQVCAP